ncbi:MAG TPA: hypothetical protein VEK57_01985 [Thermoanaerobaculia bacterium]|nr:hypothetical protein [Thermoanaerobaculia bacterium]
MKAAIRAVVIILVVIVLPADLAFSEAQKPIRDPQGCVECTADTVTGGANCGEISGWGESSWVACQGGCLYQCIPGGGACQCVPRCGNRCYSI